jgi:hypothetical protein
VRERLVTEPVPTESMSARRERRAIDDVAGNRLVTDREELFDAARTWAARTAAEQGLPVHVEDPATVARLAVLLSPGAPVEHRRAPAA